MKVPAILFLALTVSLLASCVPFAAPTTGGRPVREVYDEAGGDRDEIRLHAESYPGGVPRTRPVIYPPKVFAVYVQEHLDLKRDIKIGAHWVYFKLRDSSWIAQDIDREPFAEGQATSDDLVPLKAASFSQIVVPYRAAPSKTSGEDTREFKND